MANTRGKGSPFTAYLAEPEIQNQIHKNIKRHSKSQIKDSNPYQILCRIFSDLPIPYDGLEPFFDVLPEASQHTETELWVDLIVYKGMLDLFDESGQLHEAIYYLLNAKESGKAFGILDYLIEQLGMNVVYAHLLSAYVFTSGERALKLLQTDACGIPDDPSQEIATDPIYTCSSALNERCKQLGCVDRDYIAGFKSRLVNTTNDETVRSTGLVRLTKQLVDNQITGLGDNPMTFFSLTLPSCWKEGLEGLFSLIPR